jgi:transcription elongation factor Elf1
MAKKTKRELADEAWQRNFGQIDILDGSIEGVESAPPPTISGIPELCPSCGRQQTFAAGWSAIYTTKSPTVPMDAKPMQAIQCGACGSVFSVPALAALEYFNAMRAWFRERDARLDREKKQREERKARRPTRGAG